MGKIRVKTLDTDEKEKEQKIRDEKRREAKRAKKETDVKIKPSGGKGGERVKLVGPSDEEVSSGSSDVTTDKISADEKAKKIEKAKSTRTPHVHSKRFIEIKTKVERNKYYSFNDAVTLLIETANTKFVSSIEAHFNLTRKPKELNLKKDKSLPISFEKKFPLAHAKLGSVKDTQKALKEQFEIMIKKIGKGNIIKVTLSSTMGPGVKVEL